ncbi:MAG: SPASM domain-containing protein [Deltaproteobacteria bacterium]|nr:SPASM domain-containing protein [Deltaproteobacteria bacterium]
MPADYKISRFTMVEPLNGQNLIVLFNTLNKGVGSLPAQIWKEVNSGSFRNESTLAHLLDQGFIVSADIDEDIAFAHWRRQRAYDLTHLHYIINTTYGCDIKCSHCYFGQIKKIRYMTRETARLVLDFITKDLEQKRPVSVHLDFGGPDTTLNPEIILYLAEGLHRFCRGRRILFRISLSSNGLDLKRSLIENLKPFGLNKVRIKIGGPGLIHDQLRPDKDGRPTLEKILHNLTKIAGLIEIHLISHNDPNLEDHLLSLTLLNDLLLHGLIEYITSVRFHPIFPAENKTNLKSRQVGWMDCLFDMNPQRHLWLNDQIAAWGFLAAKEPPECRRMTGRRDTMVINVEGQITACPFQVDLPEFNYGHVKTGIDFYRESNWLAKDLPEKCRSCVIAPMCNGGCHYLGFLETGRVNEVYCVYESLEQLIRSHIRHTAQNHNFKRLPQIPQYYDSSIVMENR